MAKLTWWRSTALVGFVLASCGHNPPPKPFSWEVSPTEAVAQMDEIRDRPVLIRFLNSTSESPAQIGTVLRAGESVRTEAKAMTQVAMKNGAVVRIGEKSAFTLKSSGQVSADSGYLLVAARLENGKPLTKPIEVQTPFGAIDSANAVFHLEIPTQPNKNRTVFVLEGTLTTKLRSGKSIILKKGDELQIKPDGTGAKTLRPTQAELESRFAKSDLLFGFATRFAGQSLWEGQLKVARREIGTVRYRPEDLARNRPPASPTRAPVRQPFPTNTSPSNPTNEPVYRSEPVAPPPVKPTTAPEAVPPEVVTAPEPPPVSDPPISEPPPVIEPSAPEPLPVIEPPAPELPPASP